MKYFLITITSIMLFNACSYQNAFSKFDMTHKEELLASNTQSSKIISKDSVKGITTVIYLNNVDPKHSDEYENFLVTVYMKDGEEQYDFKLNKIAAVEVIQLSDISFYSDFIQHPRKWDTVYLVRFASAKKKIAFTLEGATFSSSALHYLKDPQ